MQFKQKRVYIVFGCLIVAFWGCATSTSYLNRMSLGMSEAEFDGLLNGAFIVKNLVASGLDESVGHWKVYSCRFSDGRYVFVLSDKRGLVIAESRGAFINRLKRKRAPDFIMRKDFYVHLLAYNLIRTIQLEASRQQKVDPLTLSFCATIQHLSNFACLLAHAAEEQRAYEYTQLIYLVSTEKLPFRPNRVEPRAVKRRPKAYPRLTKPRKQLKRKLMNDRYFVRATA